MTDPLDGLTFSDAPAPGPEFVTPKPDGIFDEPKRRFARRPSATAKPRELKAKKEIPNKPGQFVEPLETMYLGLGMISMPFDPEIAMYLTMPGMEDDGEGGVRAGNTGAFKCAVAWDEAAQRSPELRRMLSSLTTAGVWGAVFVAHMPILMLIVKNHTPFASKFDPASAMEEMLRKQQEAAE